MRPVHRHDSQQRQPGAPDSPPMSRPLSAASSSSLPSGRGTPSASNALPETSSYYRNSIEAARNAQSDQRFRTPNTLYRTPSAASIRSKKDAPAQESQAPAAAVDDDIADGLPEPVTGSAHTSRPFSTGQNSSYELDNDTGFLPARDSRRTTGSILPSAAFFAPKRPPQSVPASIGRAYSGGAGAQGSVASQRAGVQDQLDVRPEGPSSSDAYTRLNGSTNGLVQPSSSYDTSTRHGHASSLAHQGIHYISATSGTGVEIPSVRGQASRDGLLAMAEQDRSTNMGERRKLSKGLLGDVFTHKTKGATKRTSRGYAQETRQTVPASSKAKAKGKKGYKLHRGANRFFFGGLIMTSDDNPLPFLACLVLMIGLPVIWFVFEASYTWHQVSPAPVIVFAYVWAVAFASMCVTAWRDPGVLPRNLDPDPPCTAGEGGTVLTTDDPLAIPLPRVVRVRHGTDLKVKWCDTCGTYRPPRSSHCRVCDNCVENIDHHCTFLNTCIGRRNYFSFFAFLIFSIISCLISIAFSALHIVFLTRPTDYALPGGGFGEGKTFRQALQATPVSAVLFIVPIAVVIPLTTLFLYHVRLVCMNRTTVEQIRINTTRIYSEKPTYDEENGGSRSALEAPPSAFRRACLRCIPCGHLGSPGRDPNPFAYRSIFRNLRTALLRPVMSESWIDRYRHADVDERRPNPGRKAN